MGKLNENIVILRKQNKMSQSDLANLLFVTPQAVSRWERGETEPDIETIKKLAEVFHASLEEVVNGPKSKLTKRMEIVMHRSYFIGSIIIVLLAVLFCILGIFEINYVAHLIIFAILSLLYLLFILVCEIVQQRLLRQPYEEEKEKENTKESTKK